MKLTTAMGQRERVAEEASLGVYAVMDIGCPHARCKEQQLKCQEVHGHKE